MMSKRYSIIGVYSDGRQTTLLANAAADEATLIAVGMQQSATEFIRIDVVAEMPRSQLRTPAGDATRVE